MWLITHRTLVACRYRAPSGHLTIDISKAERFATANEAFEHAHEGDTVEPDPPAQFTPQPASEEA